MSTYRDYFSINEIITTQDKVSCKFEVPVLKLGFLDPSSDSENISSGTKLDIPLWLAQGLCSRRRKIVTVDVPKIYKESYRDILLADANVVDLHKLGPAFYDFAVHFTTFDHKENVQVIECLAQAFKDRVKKIMDVSHNYLNVDVNEYTSKLDEFEKILFQIGKESVKDFQNWHCRESEKITTSTVVINHRKRKRSDDE